LTSSIRWKSAWRGHGGARIIDQDIDGFVRRDPHHGLLEGRCVGHVGNDKGCRVPGINAGFECRFIAAQNGDAGTLAGQRGGNRGTDASPAACHQGIESFRHLSHSGDPV
jgi:hypothetical protein